ncbi:phosphoribosyl 1,2-cyclic phosphodiesterase [Fontibacillus solani]|uniref:Phosphoribosyl 1,2-cyclic phosphodiesterase n=1 Tax=Fontibacillus solani TaxID=1572857 RepID=A0A7W3STI0_9BACL|nr:MBL fold metallo-hydrolase [Fontibacillus solani]MBA9085961.1 phosphoribosyl 1,2-cyclic phosphodiesterase [Fontibacillus solani]
MGLRFTVLSSGSTGNATLVANGEVTLMIDAGFSARRIDELLQERGVTGNDINGILITHEHSDHIKGLGAVARKYNLPIYANEKTWSAMEKSIGKISEENRCLLGTGETRDFGSMRVESFAISHDAAEPVAYSFYDGKDKLSVCTDLGYASDKVKMAIADSDVLVLEANHDIEMLRMGRYPWNIKRRILGDLGHLSNEATGELMSELMNGRMKRTYLAHLSREHNIPDLARMSVRSAMEDRGCFYKDSEFKLCDTYYDRPTPWDRVADL